MENSAKKPPEWFVNNESQTETNKTPRRLRLLFDSQEEASKIVVEFWDTVHKGEISQNVLEKPTQEITSGDRTHVVKGIMPGEKGKWVLIIQGNNQDLSAESFKWLKAKGFIK